MSWVALAVLAAAAVNHEQSTLIRGARVFDGTGAPATVGNVLIKGDRIAGVGKDIKAPRGSKIIDASGLTLIPGLHDLHTHLRSPAFEGPDDLGKAYAGHLVNGITTVNDYSVSGEMLEPIREMTGSGTVPAPNLRLAIRLGVPGGHGTEFGWGRTFTLEATTPRAAHLAMARALSYKPDLIKVFADGWRYGRSPDRNSMDQPTLAAIVADAHAAGIKVVTHTVTLDGAKIAAMAGVDAVVHGIGDALADDEVIRLMKANNTSYVATLTAYEPQQDRAFPSEEWQDLRPPERAREERRLAAPLEPIPPYEAGRWKIMQENIGRMKAAGIRVGIGTDAGIDGVYHGSSALREIRWLTLLGFTPAEALAAATSVSAEILGQGDDHGRIAVGQRADLVLTGGRPDENIADLHDVRNVFVAGREMPLKALRRLIDGDAPSPLPAHRMAGPIDTGARTDGRTDLDTLPADSMERGPDHSHIDYVRPNEGEDKRLFLVAQMGAQAKPFAQLVLPFTKGSIQLADATGFTGIAFDARGTGDYRLLFDSYGIDDPLSYRSSFEAGEETREVRVPFSAFTSPDAAAILDLTKLRALIVQLRGEPGSTAWLQLSNVRFYR